MLLTLDVDPHARLSLGAAPGDCPPGDPPPELPVCPASEGQSTDKLIAQHSRHDFNRTGQQTAAVSLKEDRGQV